jgi:hypothetical protein
MSNRDYPEIDWRWVTVAQACDKLLARLQKYHTNKNAAGSEPAAFEGGGLARPAHVHQPNATPPEGNVDVR